MRTLLSCLALAAVLLLLEGCNATRHLPEGETFYLGPGVFDLHAKPIDGKKHKIKDKTSKRIIVWSETLKSPNGAFMGIPFIRLIPVRVGFYNVFYTEKEAGFNHWMMENFGEPPLSVEDINPEVRRARAEAALFAIGHLDVSSSYEIKYRKSGKRAKVHYHFYLGPMYHVSAIEIQANDPEGDIQQLLEQYRQSLKVQPGSEFNIGKVERDKSALIKHLQDQGYFYLNENSIRILADTTGGNQQVRIRYQLSPDLSAGQRQKVQLDSLAFTLDVFGQTQLMVPGDSTPRRNGMELRNDLIHKAILLEEGQLYQKEAELKSLQNLYSTGVFRRLRVDYAPHQNDSSRVTAVYAAELANKTKLSLEGAVSTKTNHFIGPSVGLDLTQNNLFGGAENLSYGIEAFYDFPTGILRESSTRSTGLGVFANLSYPLKKNYPFLLRNSTYGMPKINLTSRVDFNNRTDYFRLINVNMSYGLSWRTGEYTSHRLNFIDVNYNNLLQTTAVFDSLLASNIQVARSFQDQFFIGPGYTFLYNNTRNADLRNRLYLKLTTEFSGNIIYGAQSLILSEADSKRNLLGLPYAQYAIFSTDLRYYHYFTPRQSLVFRLTPAIGLSMGNSQSLPFIKQFYIGGTNNLRPLAARSIGPGVYIPSLDEIASSDFFINNSGDLLLSGNLEYRFHLLYKLEAALWSDFGNVFLLREDPVRPGGQFQADEFLQQMIMTGGVGLRLDFDYLVLRWDVGTIIHYPWFDPGLRWSWQNGLNLWGGVIAIGYPF